MHQPRLLSHMRDSSKKLPLARRERLIVKKLKDEVLIYDLDRDKAHCLNRSAAAIWQWCDGRTSPAQIASKLQKETGQAIDQRFVWLVLEQLGRDSLLELRLEWPATIPRISRREAVRRIGLSAVLPIVVSITAPMPAQAASCKASGDICANSAECCGGFCLGNHHCR